jgi:predicted nucleic acid-binding protein
LHPTDVTVTFVYDAGALIAAERNDRAVWADHRARLELGIVPITTAPVIAQVSRSDRQAQLRRFLRGCEVVPFAPAHAHAVGALLGATGSADAIDAHVVWVAGTSGASVLSSDTDDLPPIAAKLASPVRIVAADDEPSSAPPAGFEV